MYNNSNSLFKIEISRERVPAVEAEEEEQRSHKGCSLENTAQVNTKTS